jgi:hypothetical protein
MAVRQLKPLLYSLNMEMEASMKVSIQYCVV